MTEVAASVASMVATPFVTYMGALSHIIAILIPRISAHPSILVQCKVHRPWALFREGMVANFTEINFCLLLPFSFVYFNPLSMYPSTLITTLLLVATFTVSYM